MILYLDEAWIAYYCFPFFFFSSSNTLNLDVTALIAYISDLTNGGANYTFQEPILSQQAEWERSHPTKPILEELFKGNIQESTSRLRINLETAANHDKSGTMALLVENYYMVPYELNRDLLYVYLLSCVYL